MTTGELRQARAVCADAFAFLTTDFGYQKCRERFQWRGFQLGYCGPVMGVVVEWYPRDPLTVWVVRLVDGDFPPRTDVIGPASPLYYFDLRDVELVRSQHSGIDERELYSMPTGETARMLANSLRDCGSDLLRGDLALLPALEQRIRGRAREGAVARWGHEGAQQRGW